MQRERKTKTQTHASKAHAAFFSLPLPVWEREWRDEMLIAARQTRGPEAKREKERWKRSLARSVGLSCQRRWDKRDWKRLSSFSLSHTYTARFEIHLSQYHTHIPPTPSLLRHNSLLFAKGEPRGDELAPTYSTEHQRSGSDVLKQLNCYIFPVHLKKEKALFRIRVPRRRRFLGSEEIRQGTMSVASDEPHLERDERGSW